MTKYRYNDDELANAVSQSVSIAGVMRLLGIKPAGGSHFHISRRIKRSGIDTSHFTGQGHNRGQSFPARRKEAEDILVQRHRRGTRERPHLLRRALSETGAPYECAHCGTSDTWNGEKLTLHVDHINGDPLDCRRENLQFLCPNCHSQTANYCRKASARGGSGERP